MLKFEESSLQRRYKLQGGVTVGGRLAMEEGLNMEQLQKRKRELG